MGEGRRIKEKGSREPLKCSYFFNKESIVMY